MQSNTRRVAGNFLIYLAAIGLIGGSATKFLAVPAVVSMLNSAGFEGRIPLVATLELLSALLIAIPFTRSLGLPFVSAYLGGAIATDLQHGHPFLPAAILLAVIWTGMLLRHAQVAWSVDTGPLPARPQQQRVAQEA